MKVTRNTMFTSAYVCLPALFFAACGGGGSSNNSTAPAPSATNAFAAMQGTYASGCSDSPNSSGSESYTLQISNLKGSAGADFSATAKTYSLRGCIDANKRTDGTVTGTLTASNATKTITAQAAADSVLEGGINKSGIANIVDVGISKITISMGSISAPSNIMTARVGYLAEGSKLYALVHTANQPDGIGAFFSKIQLTKQ